MIFLLHFWLNIPLVTRIFFIKIFRNYIYSNFSWRPLDINTLLAFLSPCERNPMVTNGFPSQRVSNIQAPVGTNCGVAMTWDAMTHIIIYCRCDLLKLKLSLTDWPNLNEWSKQSLFRLPVVTQSQPIIRQTNMDPLSYKMVYRCLDIDWFGHFYNLVIPESQNHIVQSCSRLWIIWREVCIAMWWCDFRHTTNVR